MPFPFDLIELAACTVNLILYLCSLNIFLSSKRERPAVLYCLSGIPFLALTWLGDYLLPNLLVSLLGIICMGLISLYFYDDSLIKRLLAPLLYNIFDIITTMLIYYPLNYFQLDILQKGSLGNFDRILYLLLIYILQCGLLHFAAKFTFRDSEMYDWKVPLLFFTSDFIIVLLCHVILGYLTPDDRMIGLLCTIICTVMFFVTLFVLYLIGKLEQQNQNEKEAELLRLLLEQQKKQMVQFQNDREKLHALRHDMKHYLLNYQLMLQRGEIESVQRDIQQMLESRLVVSDVVYTNNHAVNALILFVRELCSEKSISFDVKVILPPSFENIDIMTAMLNLLENAMEAETHIPEENRYISMDIINISGNLSIIVRNKILESVIRKNGSLKSTKHDMEHHGYGIRNVRHVTRLYNGIMDLYEQDGLFCVHLFFPHL